MSLILLWLFQLKVANCVINFPYNILPWTLEQKQNFCIEQELKKERQ